MSARPLRQVAELGRATAAGYAQMLFAESPLGGTLMLLGLIPVMPRAAAGAALAGALATVVARLRGYPRAEWERGFYGYSAALTGAFWGMLFVPSARGWLVLVAAALAAAPLTRVTHRWLTPRQIPALALPALALTWLAAPFLTRAATPSGGNSLLMVCGWALTLAGLTVSSPLLAVTA